VVAVSFPEIWRSRRSSARRGTQKTASTDPSTTRRGDLESPGGRHRDQTELDVLLRGPKCLVKEIQKLSGLSINRFIAVDFAGFRENGRRPRGVQVSPAPAARLRTGHGSRTRGRQVIDGPTALNYVRARQVTTETNGDYGRIKRQQLFVSSLLRSLISEDTLLDLNKLNNVVNMFIGRYLRRQCQDQRPGPARQSLQGMAAAHHICHRADRHNGRERRRASTDGRYAIAVRRHHHDDPLPQENDHNAKSWDVAELGLSLGAFLGPGPAPTPRRRRPRRHPRGQRQQVMHDLAARCHGSSFQRDHQSAWPPPPPAAEADGFNVMTPDDYRVRSTQRPCCFPRQRAGRRTWPRHSNARSTGFRLRAGRSSVLPGLQLGDSSGPQRLVGHRADRTRSATRRPRCRGLDGYQRGRHTCEYTTSGHSPNLSGAENVGLAACGTAYKSSSRIYPRTR